MKIIKNMPVPSCALALSLATLGGLVAQYGDIFKFICGAISFLILLFFTIKIINYHDIFKEDVRNSLSFSMLPTYTMAVMILSTYLKPLIGICAFYIWAIAIIAHFSIIILFAKSHLIRFDIKSVFPSYFIVAVGFVVASVTSPIMGMQHLGLLLFYGGFTMYFVVLFIVSYRLLAIGKLSESTFPTVAIFVAPINLCLAGYLSTASNKNMLLIVIMLVISLISYLGVLAAIVFILVKSKSKFYPTFAAFTFPLAISAVAYKMTNVFLTTKGVELFSFVSLASMLIAIAVIAFVFYKYCIYLFLSPSN